MRASFSASARKRDRDGKRGNGETGKQGNRETGKRWGLLERSPKPQELSRYILDWNRRSCPVPDLSCSIHGGCDFGCCRIGLAASAGIGKSGMTPDIGTSAPAGVHSGKPPLAWVSPPVPVPRWASPPPGNANAGSARAARIQPLAREFRPCSGAPLGKPRRVTPTQVQPAPPGFSPGDARGEAPCMK